MKLYVKFTPKSFFAIVIGSPPRNTTEHLSDYERFQEKPSKSFFKELFFGTPIGYRLKKMTKRNGVVKGLCDQECECGNVAKQPLISYVPVTDEVQEALNINHKERLQKIKLPNSTEFNATIWYTGTPEEFTNHVKQAVHACDRMGLFEVYKKALMEKGKAVRLRVKAILPQPSKKSLEMKSSQAFAQMWKPTRKRWRKRRRDGPRPQKVSSPSTPIFH